MVSIIIFGSITASLASRCISSNMLANSGVVLIFVTKSRIRPFFSASGIFNKATKALNADLFNSSFFSYSCLTALLLTFCKHVFFRGSIKRSNPINIQLIFIKNFFLKINFLKIYFVIKRLDKELTDVQALDT